MQCVHSLLIQIADVKNCVKIPIIIGSGVTASNVQDYSEADGLIVGTHFKVNERYCVVVTTSMKNNINLNISKYYNNTILIFTALVIFQNLIPSSSFIQ